MMSSFSLRCGFPTLARLYRFSRPKTVMLRRLALCQNEFRCSDFEMEITFHSHANKTHFHKKGCAPSLILKLRVFGTRKWPIEMTLLYWRILVVKWRHRGIYRTTPVRHSFSRLVRKFYICLTAFPMKLYLGLFHCIIIYNCDTFVSVLGSFSAEIAAKNANCCEAHTSRASRAKCAFRRMEARSSLLISCPAIFRWVKLLKKQMPSILSMMKLIVFKRPKKAVVLVYWYGNTFL